MTRGRPREFDKNKALDKAVKLFWQRGYRLVTLDDISEALGVVKPSLYSAFGDKESLFLQSVDRYREAVIGPVYSELLKCEKLTPGLRSFFRAIGSRVTQKDSPGCLIACIMPQASAESPAIKKRLAEVIAKSDEAFAKVLALHPTSLRQNVEPKEAGTFMTSAIHGMAIRAKSGATLHDLEPIGEIVIKAICK